MSNQPEALRLADQLKDRFGATVPTSQAAAELRRQHEEIERLRRSLSAKLSDHINGTPCAEIRHHEEVEALRAELAALRHENHNLNWALGSDGYERMYTEEEQAASDAAQAQALKNIERLTVRMERLRTLVPVGVDPLDVIEQQHAELAALQEDLRYVAHSGMGSCAPAPAASTGWQPIETAPRSGVLVLLLERLSDEPFIGRWSDFRSRWVASTTHYDTDGNACVVDCVYSEGVSHWMPLPAAPKGGE